MCVVESVNFTPDYTMIIFDLPKAIFSSNHCTCNLQIFISYLQMFSAQNGRQSLGVAESGQKPIKKHGNEIQQDGKPVKNCASKLQCFGKPVKNCARIIAAYGKPVKNYACELGHFRKPCKNCGC